MKITAAITTETGISWATALAAALIMAAGCATEDAGAPPAQSRVSARPFSEKETWPAEPWGGVYIPGEFIRIRPSVQIVSDGLLAIRWKTSDFAKSWAEVSDDGGKTWRKCGNNTDGIRNEFGTDFTAFVEDYDMTRPLKYRVLAYQIEAVDTWGHYRFADEEWVAGEFTGGYYPVKDYKKQIALRREKSTAAPFTAEGEIKAVDTNSFDIVFLNDIHHGLSLYPELLRQIGDKTAVIVLGGDILDHARSRQDFEKHLEAPMAYITENAKCASVFLRGNHETMGLYASKVRAHMALHRNSAGKAPAEAMYGAYTIGNTRILFMDTANDVESVYNPRSSNDILSEVEPYFAQEAEWLAGETVSDQWKNAANKVAFAHIPCGYSTNSPLSRTIFPVLAESGLNLYCAGHNHSAEFFPKNVPFGKNGERIFPYDIAVGGGMRLRGTNDFVQAGKKVNWQTAVIVSVRDGKMSVKCIDTTGEKIY